MAAFNCKVLFQRDLRLKNFLFLDYVNLSEMKSSFFLEA